MTGLTSTLRTSLTTGALGDLPMPVGAELASRQHAFYATLSQNPNLHKGHPLSHMVSNGPPGSSGVRAPGTAPLGGSRSAPALGAVLPRDAVTAPSMSEQHLIAPANVGQFSTLQAPAEYESLDAPQAWGSGSLHATRGAGSRRRDAMAKVEARGGATLRAYNSPPSNAAELAGPTGVGGRGSKRGSKRGGTRTTRGSRGTPAVGASGSRDARRMPSEGGFGTSASKHQDFLSQMTQDVKGRVRYPSVLCPVCVRCPRVLCPVCARCCCCCCDADLARCPSCCSWTTQSRFLARARMAPRAQTEAPRRHVRTVGQGHDRRPRRSTASGARRRRGVRRRLSERRRMQRRRRARRRPRRRRGASGRRRTSGG